MTATVFIVDDDPGMRNALTGLLEIAGLQASGYADGAAFLAACGQHSTGCVLLDVSMPGMSGQQVQAEMKVRGLCLPIIFLTGHGDVPMAVRALQDGAVDFLEKPIQSELLLERIHHALKLDEQRCQKQAYENDIRQRHARLSSREREIMVLVVSGLSNKEIARQLDLSPRTVEVHRSHVMHKMGADNVAELVTMATCCQA